MRRLVLLGSLAIAIVVFLPFAGFLTARNVTPTTCDGDGISQPIIPGPIPDVPGLTDGQVRLAKIIWLQAHRLSPRLGGSADQASVIAIAVASQESTLGANPSINRPNADGDAGPFQQRTLPGWYGTLAQVTDPTYAANTFLLGHTVTARQYAQAIAAGSRPAGRAGYHIPGLADVPDWANIDIIDAADQVQHSAFPDAVADDIPVARKLVAALDGGSSTGVIADAVGAESTDPCGGGTHPTECPPSGSPAETRLKPDTLLVLRCVKQQFPKITTFYGYRAHDQYPEHPSGRAVDIMISSAYRDFNSPDAVAYGTKVAEWVKAHHAELGVQYIIYRQHIWNVQRASEGWRLMPDRGSPTANHMDHVHVTTYGNAAKPTGPPPKIIGGKAVTPVERYTITATFGEVGSWARYHTGLDFAAPIGTPVRAALAGTVTHAGYGGAAGTWAGDWVSIKHADGTSTLYAHMSATNVVEGQSVMTGQRIGTIGVTGRSFGPHLHFETYSDGIHPGDIYRATDPARWLAKRDTNVDAASMGSAR
jgi:murein DD-endopeptidase MepM/ murein hydrolase activator NlpD